MGYVPQEYNNERYVTKIVDYLKNQFGDEVTSNYIELNYKRRFIENYDKSASHIIMVNYFLKIRSQKIELFSSGYGSSYNDALVEVAQEIYDTIKEEKNKNRTETVDDLLAINYDDLTEDQFDKIINHYVDIEKYEHAGKFKQLKEIVHGQTDT